MTQTIKTYAFRSTATQPEAHKKRLTDSLSTLEQTPVDEWQNWLSLHNDWRSGQPCRTLLVADTPDALLGQLKTAIESTAQPNPQQNIGFLYTGQGAQRPQMAKILYEHFPIFRQTIDACHAYFASHYNLSLLELLTSDQPEVHAQLNQTGATQPALYAFEVALAALWQQLGVHPAGVMGHSVGEFAACTTAGVFSLEEGLRLISDRAQGMQALPEGGGMLAVLAGQTEIETALADFEDATAINYAAMNAPKQTVLSGSLSALQAFSKTARRAGIKCIPLQVSHAFHSYLMEPMLDAFIQTASSIPFSTPKIPVISNVTASMMPSAPDAQYWADHIRKPVKFMDSLNTLIQQGCTTFIEIGPQPVLINMGLKTHGSEHYQWLSSIDKGQPELNSLLTTLVACDHISDSINWTAAQSLLTLPTAAPRGLIVN